jgi:ribonuclease HI
MTGQSKIQSIYTDGACSGNPGPGGWGVVVCFADGSLHELGGDDRQTTNNRMEMQAAIAALEFFAASQQADSIELYTDSEYLKNGVTQWIHGWKKKGWKTSTGKPVLNQDLWEQLDALNSMQVQWRYVRGHAGNVGNERCDAIARAFSQGKIPILKQQHPQAENRFVVPPDLRTTELLLQQKTSSAPLLSQDMDSPVSATTSNVAMMDSHASVPADSLDLLPREVRVGHLRDLVDVLHIADEIASKGYLITSSELADLMDINASAVTSRGDHWVWRNWVVSRVRREGNQILWQLERVD